jgi:hypothetical protein
MKHQALQRTRLLHEPLLDYYKGGHFLHYSTHNRPTTRSLELLDTFFFFKPCTLI